MKIKYENLKIGQSLWSSDDSESVIESVIAAKYRARADEKEEEEDFIVFEADAYNVYSLENINRYYFLTKELVLLDNKNKKKIQKEAIKSLFELEKLFIEKKSEYNKLYDDNRYISEGLVAANSRFNDDKKRIRKLCLMFNMSAECFDYHIGTYDPDYKEQRAKTLGLIGVIETNTK
jgi:hypothetical protein